MNHLSVDIKSKKFLAGKKDFSAIRDLRMDVAEGEFLCLVGPSGCGKTTLLNIIAGLDLDYDGDVLYGGSSVQKCDASRLVIFQELALFPWLTVRENVEFGLRARRVPRIQRREIARKYLDMVHLTKFENSFIHEISGGMKQRVAIARALAVDPKVLMMDEPFTALDAQTRDMLHAELQRIWKMTKKTIIFVTHNVREAVCLGDRVLVLSTSPARIKAEFKIDLSRPRQIENHELIDKVKLVLQELKFEIEVAAKREFNESKNH